jgi:hypothetical protein
MIPKSSHQVNWRNLLLILIFSLMSSCLYAQKEIPDSLVTERLRFIKNTLQRDKTKTQWWWYGWQTTYSVATVGQYIVYLKSDTRSSRQNMALGAATTLLGVVGQFIVPIIPGNEPEKYNRIPETSRSERLTKLAFAEELFSECAKREKLAMSWKNHAMTGAINLGGGLITWLGFKRSVWDGIGYFAFNTVITETQIWTQPTIAKRNYRKYLLKYPEYEEGISYQPEINWSLKVYPGGIGIRVVF